MNTKTRALWTHCNACGQQTEHKRLRQAERRREIDYERHTAVYGSTWQMLQCKGCHEVFLERTDWSSDDESEEDAHTTYFPPRVSRREPAWIKRNKVPLEYRALLNEVYTALHADSRRLAAMGARALIDTFINRCIGDKGTFAEKLAKLVEENFIREAQRQIIDAAIDAGSAAAHRGHCPNANDLNTVIDIVENLIHNELLAKQEQPLRANTPARPKPGGANAQQTA